MGVIGLDVRPRIVGNEGVEFIADVALSFFKLPVFLDLADAKSVKVCPLFVEFLEALVGGCFHFDCDFDFVEVNLMNKVIIVFNCFRSDDDLVGNQCWPVLLEFLSIGQGILEK